MAAFPNFWREAAAPPARAMPRPPANILKELDILLLARLVLRVPHQAGLSLRFAKGMKMQSYQPGTFWREDTLFGVCEALGEDFRFNPLFLRAALAIGLLWAPLTMIYAYLGLAAIVLVSRLIAPNPRQVARPEAEAEPGRPAADETDQYPLPIAA